MAKYTVAITFILVILMKILKTPWQKEFLELVAKSEKSIKITSPFVKENICDKLLNVKRKNTSLDLVTSFKLMNIYSGSLDISALEKILDNNGIVKSYPKLHSKIYLFDDKEAIITSGNLTNGGLISNFEYGIYLNDELLVSKILTDYHKISNDETTGIISKSHMSITKDILSKIPKKEKLELPRIDTESPEENFDIIEIENSFIISALKGWKLEIFKCVNSIPQQEFSLSEINRFESYLKKIYPTNNHIPDKIRQQLQSLRDLGLIEFLGGGRYKKLWK